MDRLETEWRFDASNLDQAEEWFRRTRAVLAPSPAEAKTLRHVDSYFDTEDWRIYRSGYSLRIRRAGRDCRATLKSLESTETNRAVRREIEEPVPTATPEALFIGTGPVSERLRSLCRAEDLQALVEIGTTRKTLRLKTEQAAGELALDRTSWRMAGRAMRLLRRVELEVREGDPESFAPLVERFVAECPVRPTCLSKFVWALSAAGRTPPSRPRPSPGAVHGGSPIGDVVLGALRHHFSLALWNEPGTRLGDDPNFLHDMRVAVRRMRAVMLIFKRALAGGPVAELRERLRTLGLTLGQVRDLDVRIEQVAEWSLSLLTVPSGSLDSYVDLLRQERDQAREVMLHYLDSPEYRDLCESIRTWLAPDVKLAAEALIPACLEGERLLRRTRGRVLRLGRTLSVNSEAAVFHRQRTLCKRFRYAMEFFRPVYGDVTGPAIEAVVRLQDILGLHQDAQVAIGSIRSLLLQPSPGLPPAALAALGELAQLHASRADRLRIQFAPAFKKLRGSGWKKLKREIGRQARIEEAVEEFAAESATERATKGTIEPAAGSAGILADRNGGDG